MKVKVSHLLASIVTVILFVLSAQAQEQPLLEIQDPSHREFNLDDDKTLIYDHPTHSSSRDSLQSMSRIMPSQQLKSAKPDAHKNTVKEDEDALSFNFIYYIIEKFKMSDLIDQ